MADGNEAMIVQLADDSMTQVDDRFKAAYDMVTQATTDLNKYLQALIDASLIPSSVLSNLNADISKLKFDFNAATAPTLENYEPPLPQPDAAGLTFNPPGDPGAFVEVFEAGNIPVVTAPTEPTLQMNWPSISIPAAPSATLPPAPGDPPPLIVEDDFPDAPVILGSDAVTWPTAPVLQQLSIPGLPDVSYPVWDSEKVIISLIPPDLSFSWFEPSYSSPVKDALMAKIKDMVENGGTGLGADAEAALWERMRGRKDQLNERQYTEANQYFAARGFSLPPGALSGRLLEALAEINRNEMDINADITFKQADLMWQATQFFVDAGVKYEAQAWQEWNSIVQRTFEGQKIAIDSAIQIFNAKVQYENLLLEKYKTEAAVYDSLMRGAIARLEAYKTQLEGVRVSAEIQKLAIENYTALLGGVQLIYDVYKTKLSAIQIKTEIDKLNLEAFQLTVNIYIAQVQAKTAEYNMYESRIKGEMAKVEVYDAAVKAYGAEVEAYKAKYSALVQVLAAKVDVYKADIEKYRVSIETYKTATEIQTQKVDAAVKKYGVDVEQFKADLSGSQFRDENAIKIFMAKLEAGKENLAALVEKVKAETAEWVEASNLSIEAAKAQGAAAAQELASAFQGISATASVAGHAQYGITSSYYRDVTHTDDSSGDGHVEYQHTYQNKP